MGSPGCQAAAGDGPATAAAGSGGGGGSGAPPVARTGYQNFGSFHSDNVEEMVADAGWRPPPNPCEQSVAALAGAPLGAAMRPHFLIDFDRWTFLNHGAFGAPFSCAQAEAEAWRRRCEAQPLLFLDRELFSQLVRVVRELAAFVGAHPADLALLPNATTGLNTVIASVRERLRPGDSLFSLDIGYGSVKKMLAVAAAAAGARHVELAVRLEGLSGPEDLVAQVAAALPPSCKLAVFDAVTSNTAIVLPIRELVQLCHEHGIEVLVDGAHAPGQLDLDLGSLGADFFVANCHKWLCAPRGSAFLHVQRRHQARVRPLIVSHGWGAGFVSEFIWDGCRDYAPLLGMSAALRALRVLGPQAVRAHQRALLAEAADLLTRAWGTGTLVPLAMCGAMALVRLPPACVAAARAAGGSQVDGAAGGAGAAPAATSADAKWVQDSLHYRHSIECPVKCIAGRLYVRISAHIYNERADYERLAAAVRSLAAAAAGSS